MRMSYSLFFQLVSHSHESKNDNASVSESRELVHSTMDISNFDYVTNAINRELSSSSAVVTIMETQTIATSITDTKALVDTSASPEAEAIDMLSERSDEDSYEGGLSFGESIQEDLGIIIILRRCTPATYFLSPSTTFVF